MSEQQTPESRPHHVVVVGAGMAGVQTAVALREQGFAGPVTLIGAEPHQPYDRPPLSKAVLLGKAEHSAFDVDFEELDVTLRLGVEVTGLRAAAHELDTERGPVGYDALVLATGAEPVVLPGSQGVPGVHLLRTLDDAARLRPVLERSHDVVVVGAGWIGAEFTTAARAAGCAVTVVEAADHPLAGTLPAEVAAPMAAWYAESGAELLTGARVDRVEPGTVHLTDGREIPAGAVVVGIGARPATRWLAGSGIALGPDGSVTADATLRTSLPDVYAVGDCASFPSARYGERLLVHHWDNALQGPRTAAAALVEGVAPAYDPVPYFWSEQFGRFVQYAGHHAGSDTLLWRGAPTDPAWTVCWLREGVLVAVLAVGRPRDLAQGRKLVAAGARIDPVRAADPSVPLRTAAS
ncbi:MULTISPECIES: NAD(P)/FAD-dependent oxidoreductase [unclassified Streptomyces]|uniref:NAD(P)/FAD-dependent oxidoreductase n=2 Tax=unclassified Streptomyces TaxID=2593676 RepID=UPI0001C18A67|nr:FAD-dependent pyridine nucleotide-disulfide oxidoreductase [Streptomyces sp. SirexAA-E]MYR64515.1 FAD-dependent oxidoreductase [Streptomyces sp. SID4939]MYR99517.1 FAD-dependent oxidoreductase [Streptomyces sp. SID4940]MYT64687.1 FAD-dependent oxidoreductase [Streptomyces sp. SID8357]MYT87767.1 FAD-dependent oxidoreductase [Streptomyces sp. SID8360]MYW36937.1 FAD-dependent oxidoreductase [Streptomyces sp. SID1]PZX45193.1 NADPH-dependent 2,4-dienoyl-CoA reductase/sulfur reductase-like enzym